MSSFISSSKSEFKTCLAVIATLVLVEAIVHFNQHRLSADLEHLSTIPGIAQSFRNSTTGKVLFLGNSLTRQGVSVEMVKERFAGGRLDGVNWRKVHADDTNISDWYYLYKNSFHKTQSTPDVLIIGFVRNQIADSAEVHPDGIAGSFGGLSNIPEIFGDDITDLGGRAEYMLASVSSFFANRRRIGLRIADMFIPEYRSTAQYFNEIVRTDVSNVPVVAPTYLRLQRLAELCRKENTLLVMVAMPVPNAFDIDEGLTKTLSENGSVFIDLRRVDGIAHDQYADGLHLNPAGAAIYSRALADSLQTRAHLDSFLRDRLTAGK